MSVVATSVFLLFALIVLGFILGKRNIIHKESIPDLSALVLQVTMPWFRVGAFSTCMPAS